MLSCGLLFFINGTVKKNSGLQHAQFQLKRNKVMGIINKYIIHKLYIYQLYTILNLI